MRILGVDPGSQKAGVGIVDACGHRLTHVHHEVIRCGNGPFDERLHVLFCRLRDIIDQFMPEAAAIEDVFVSRNALSSLKLGQARGALIACCRDRGLAVVAYPPTRVKQAVVGTGRADKIQVQHMIRVLLHPPEPLAEDAADALAVAICHAHHIPMQQVRHRT